MLSNLAEFLLGSFGGWLVVAVIAVAVVLLVLRIVGRAVSVSLRLAIILGSLAVIAFALFALRTLLGSGGAPIL